MTVWQTMDTCPRDTQVLAGGWYFTRFREESYFMYELFYWPSESDEHDVLVDGLEPTVWTHLPEPPPENKDEHL